MTKTKPKRESRENQQGSSSPSQDDILEKLAELEHEQWMYWSKNIARTGGVFIPRNKRMRWNELWIPYAKLSEEDKEHDRKWARKVLVILKERGD